MAEDFHDNAPAAEGAAPPDGEEENDEEVGNDGGGGVLGGAPNDDPAAPAPQANVNDGNNNDGENVNDSQRRITIIATTQDGQISMITRSESDERCLPEDTFSFLIYSPVLKSRTFYLATCVFLFQMGVYAVLAYDITNMSNPKNRLKFPVNVDNPVRIAELLAFMVAIITQDEVRNAVNLLRDGFDKELLPKAFPGATWSKWIVTIVLRGAGGIFGLLITCLLIMQSTNVLDLLLNFLAMEFVSQLDDVVFILAREGFVGFLGREVQNEAKKVSNTYYRYSDPATEQSGLRGASFVTKAYFIILFVIMYSVWGVVYDWQKHGRYLCSRIFVQYGDEALPMLGTHTGLFYRQRKYFSGRASYYSYRDHQDAGGALLAWCAKETRWTLSLPKKEDKWDPCNWTAASSESDDYDVLTTANAQWVVRIPTTTNFDVVPLSHHFMACYECMNIDNFCGGFGTCNRDGMYDQCTCNEGYYGLRCEYPEPCQTLEINQRGKGFLKEGGGNVASKYYRLEGADPYNRPVYASLGDNQTLSNDTDFIVFTGVRWILSYKDSFLGLKDVNDEKKLIEYFSKKFNAKDVDASFKSEPVYTGTQEDATASPLKVQWHKIYPMDSLQNELIASSFFCAERCDDSIKENSMKPCYFGGVDICGYCPLPTSPPSETPTSIPSASGSGSGN